MITGNPNLRETVDPRVLPETARKAQALEGYAATVGIVFGYPDFSGWRSVADTTQLIAWRDEAVREGGPKAYYPVAPYGQGYHGKGAAFDIKIVRVPMGRTLAWGYATLGAFAPRIGLRWGGTFQKPNTDIFHFELAISLADAQARFDQWQSQQHFAGLSHPTATTSPKAGSAPLVAAVDAIKAVSTPTGAITLGVVVALAIVAAGFFSITVSHYVSAQGAAVFSAFFK